MRRLIGFVWTITRKSLSWSIRKTLPTLYTAVSRRSKKPQSTLTLSSVTRERMRKTYESQRAAGMTRKASLDAVATVHAPELRQFIEALIDPDPRTDGGPR